MKEWIWQERAASRRRRVHAGINRTYRDDSSQSGLSPFQELAAESGGSLGAGKRAAEETPLFCIWRPASTTVRGFWSERDFFTACGNEDKGFSSFSGHPIKEDVKFQEREKKGDGLASPQHLWTIKFNWFTIIDSFCFVFDVWFNSEFYRLFLRFLHIVCIYKWAVILMCCMTTLESIIVYQVNFNVLIWISSYNFS